MARSPPEDAAAAAAAPRRRRGRRSISAAGFRPSERRKVRSRIGLFLGRLGVVEVSSGLLVLNGLDFEGHVFGEKFGPMLNFPRLWTKS